MSASDFVKFYTEHLPKDPALKKQIDDSADQKVFLDSVLEHGKKAGFDFNQADVDTVMRASLQKGAGELDENQLEGVVGGAGLTVATPTVQITTIKSTAITPGGNYASTVMCTTWSMPAGNTQIKTY